MDSPDRADFLRNLEPGGKFAGIIGVYRHNISADRIGVFDAVIVDALAATGVKWIAHNGAGYDQIDVHACKAKGASAVISSPSSSPLIAGSSRHHGLQYPRRRRRRDSDDSAIPPRLRPPPVLQSGAQPTHRSMEGRPLLRERTRRDEPHCRHPRTRRDRAPLRRARARLPHARHLPQPRGGPARALVV